MKNTEFHDKIKYFKEFTKEELNSEFHHNCYYGHLELVKYLLISLDLKKHADIESQENLGLRNACDEGNLDIIKFLLTSKELKKLGNVHAHKDYSFKICCRNEHLEIIKFFIFELNIKKTVEIEEFLKKTPNQQINDWFHMRDIHQNLEEELFSDGFNKKKVKL